MFSYDIRLQATLIGNQASGKTALRNRLSNNSFSPEYQPTIGQDFSVIRIYDEETKKQILLTIWETIVSRMGRIPGTQAQAVIVALDLSASNSLKQQFEEFSQFLPADKLLLLVATKSDTERYHSEDELVKLANELQCGYYITSAKTGHGTKEFLYNLTKEMLHSSQKIIAKPDELNSSSDSDSEADEAKAYSRGSCLTY